MARFDLIATYIMASGRNGTLYVGASSDLRHRVFQHKSGGGSEFTGRYGCTFLVWYELHTDMARAAHRERRIKTWPRRWKLELIEALNPGWADLSHHLM